MRPAKGAGDGIYVSEHEDELISVEDDFGDKASPADYISGFEAFVKANMNAVPASLQPRRSREDPQVASDRLAA
jgi:type I restriction enzyme R subunit